MSFDSQAQEWLTQVQERLNEQVWFQELKGKWDSLDTQLQTYIKFGSLGALALGFILTFGGIYSSVQSKKNSYEQRLSLLNSLRTSGEEIRALQRQAPSSRRGGQEVNWNQYVSRTSSRAGMSGESAKLKSNRRLDHPMAEERLLEIELIKINVRQLTQFAFYLENGSEPIKLRKIKVNTEGEEGYLNATLIASAFSIEAEEENE
jgi:hypothetical protein